MRNLFKSIALALGLAVVGTVGAAQSNPVMVITVAGEANGEIRIEMRPDLAPLHVAQITELANAGAYNGVVFHRVIEGFMAQTGDVAFGTSEAFANGRAGMGGSDLPDLPAEFSDAPYERGIVGMARSATPDSANSQFFIMFDAAPSLNGQYTVIGVVVEGMEIVDAIKRGRGQNGMVTETPDVMVSVVVEPGA